MTWAEFNDAVRVHLLVHNRRQGIQALIDSLIKGALIDLQSAVPALQDGHKSVYQGTRFTTDGFAGRAHYPINAVITLAYSRNPDSHACICEYDLATTPRAVVEMTSGALAYGTHRIALVPHKGLFYVAPNPVDLLTEFVLVWTGTKTDFEDDDEVPFDDVVVQAVSEFVMARLSRTVDSDVEMARSFAASYAQTKRRIKSDANEAKHLRVSL